MMRLAHAHTMSCGTMLWIAAVSAMICMMLSLPVHAAGIKLKTGTDEQAKLPFWEISNDSMSLRLVHRLPDQTRGFFEARGFTPAQSEVIAQACVFQTVFKNNSHNNKPSPLEYDMTQWQVVHKAIPHSMKMREQWRPELVKLGVSKQARIALEWSLLPSKQTYQPGDYNWGMSIYDLKPGTQFSLKLSWKQHGKTHQYTINDIHCAADIQMDPITEQVQ